MLSDANLAATLTAGDYYIGVAASGNASVIATPNNAAGTALFDFTTNGVKDPVTGLGDYKLATDPFVAWTISGLTSPYLLPGTSNFTAGTGGYINLTGATFAVPEPSTLVGLAGMGGLLAARRRAAR
ncbi:MAG: PEP-CTERM sorting domain-containing protein [Tepidisphaeraceae bacterium]